MKVEEIDEGRLREVALTPDEYRVIVEQLKRQPNEVELGMLGVLWSEHCSYKTSKALLRRLPSSGAAVLQGPGENAGAIDVGQGWAAVFKIESHNHPSAIEPYQGAATGVGGIIRDVIAMGARPIALLDSLRFGPLPASRHHFEGVVAGIGGYGNCMGIPTVGGEVYFEDCYAQNPIVNAMCVGLVPVHRLMRARAEGTGNSLLLVGADTGRDGIHGASFASVELDEASSERRPAVQVGNPFLEKCLLEACMDLAHTDAVVGIQDLGAAGLTSSVAECAGRVAGAGARIDVSRGAATREGDDALPRDAVGVAGTNAGGGSARPRGRGRIDLPGLGPDLGGDRRGHRRRLPDCRRRAARSGSAAHKSPHRRISASTAHRGRAGTSPHARP